MKPQVSFDEWTKRRDGEWHTQLMGYTCKVAPREGGWTAWASLISGCRVLSRSDDRVYPTREAAMGDAAAMVREEDGRMLRASCPSCEAKQSPPKGDWQ